MIFFLWNMNLFHVDFYDEYEFLMRVSLLNMNFFLLNPSKLTSFKSCKSEFVKPDNLVIVNFDFEQTLTPFEIRRLMDFRSTILARLPIPGGNHISKPMTTLLANTEYICLIPNCVQLFDKWKRALTCAALIWWIYFFWYLLLYFYCCNLVGSCSCQFHKLLQALMGFDLSGNVSFNMEWLMLHRPLFA